MSKADPIEQVKKLSVLRIAEKNVRAAINELSGSVDRALLDHAVSRSDTVARTVVEEIQRLKVVRESLEINLQEQQGLREKLGL